MWKKILEAKELLSYEKATSELNVRIEARKEVNRWLIYLKYYNKNLNFTEEYTCKSEDEAREIIKCLQDSKLKTIKELSQLKLLQGKNLNVNLKRDFRDYNLEKWNFTINNDNHNNHLIFRETDFNEVEIIMNEKYRAVEERLINKISTMLGLGSSTLRTKITIYYFNNESKYYLEENYLENVEKN